MTPEQFAYWLQGFAEISQKPPTEAEWTIIKDHLATVFEKVTPNRITSPGPSVSPGKIWPNDPMKPDPWPTNPIIYPTIPAGPWTMPPNYPNPVYPTVPGIRPEIICSVQPNTSYCSTMNGSTAYSMTSDVPNVKYDYYTTAKKETIKKINKALSK